MLSEFVPFCLRLDSQASKTCSRWSLGWSKDFITFGISSTINELTDITETL